MNGFKVKDATIWEVPTGVVIAYGMDAEPRKASYPAMVPGWMPKPTKRELLKAGRKN